MFEVQRRLFEGRNFKNSELLANCPAQKREQRIFKRILFTQSFHVRCVLLCYFDCLFLVELIGEMN